MQIASEKLQKKIRMHIRCPLYIENKISATKLERCPPREESGNDCFSLETNLKKANRGFLQALFHWEDTLNA